MASKESGAFGNRGNPTIRRFVTADFTRAFLGEQPSFTQKSPRPWGRYKKIHGAMVVLHWQISPSSLPWILFSSMYHAARKLQYFRTSLKNSSRTLNSGLSICSTKLILLLCRLLPSSDVQGSRQNSTTASIPEPVRVSGRPAEEKEKDL
jgi:hypothetical protein